MDHNSVPSTYEWPQGRTGRQDRHSECQVGALQQATLGERPHQDSYSWARPRYCIVLTAPV